VNLQEKLKQLREIRSKKQKKEFKFGGLGASYIGTNQWKIAKAKRE